MRNKRAANPGFTLIELLVSISIILLLSTIAMVAVNNIRTDSRNTKRRADLKQIAQALELYYDMHGDYPDNSVESGYNEIDFTFNFYEFDSSCGGNDPNDEFLTSLIDSGIMARLPDEPIFTVPAHCYGYSSSKDWFGPNHTVGSYYLIARLELPLGEVGEKACPGVMEGLPSFMICMSMGMD